MTRRGFFAALGAVLAAVAQRAAPPLTFHGYPVMWDGDLASTPLAMLRGCVEAGGTVTGINVATYRWWRNDPSTLPKIEPAAWQQVYDQCRPGGASPVTFSE